MTEETFRHLVFSFAKVYGQPYIANHEIAELRAFLTRHLQAFTAETKCLYADMATFTVNTTPDGEFNMRDTDYFEFPMLEIRYVVINSNQLPGPNPSTGVFSLRYLETHYRDYRTATASTPAMAVQVNPKTLRLVPKPSATISNCYVSGWYLHPDLQTDSQELSLNEEDIQAAALCCAYELILPTANGPSMEKALGLKKLAEDAKKDVADRASTRFDAHDRRTATRDTRYRL